MFTSTAAKPNHGQKIPRLAAKSHHTSHFHTFSITVIYMHIVLKPAVTVTCPWIDVKLFVACLQTRSRIECVTLRLYNLTLRDFYNSFRSLTDWGLKHSKLRPGRNKTNCLLAWTCSVHMV